MRFRLWRKEYENAVQRGLYAVPSRLTVRSPHNENHFPQIGRRSTAPLNARDAVGTEPDSNHLETGLPS